MQKLIFLFLIWTYPLVCFANIDERKIDVYFANGILTDESNATNNALILRKAIVTTIYSNKTEMKKHIGKVDYAYNSTHGEKFDLLESTLQKFGWHWLNNKINSEHTIDLSKQIAKYKESIVSGNSVLVVAHSQGNLFTKEAYDALKPCMQKSFEAVSIASPMTADIKEETVRIDWDNDLVARIANFGFSDGGDITSKIRKVTWQDLDFDALNHAEGEEAKQTNDVDNYIVNANLSKVYETRFKANEGGINSDVHAFTFYMGQELKNGDSGTVIMDPFTKSPLIDTQARAKILSEIKKKLDVLKKDEIVSDVVVDIVLSWKTSSTNLELISELGEKDKQERCGEKRYFEKSEDALTPGTYAVSIAHNGEVDNNSLPESIMLDIQVLDKRMTFEFDVLTADLLNAGHAADIIIDVNADGDINASVSNQDLNRTGLQGIKIRHYYQVTYVGERGPSGGGSAEDVIGDSLCWVSDQLSYSEAVAVCEDRGSDDRVVTIEDYDEDEEGNTESGKGYVYDIKSRLNQAEFGPIGGAEMKLSLLKNSTSVYQGTTTDGSSLISTGIMLFPHEIIQNLDDNSLYLIEVSGGSDIDANDDGVLDAVATVNSGAIHAIVSGKQLKDSNFKVNILTEIVYQASKKMLNDELNVTAVIGQMDAVANKLLSVKEDTQEFSDYNDTLHWLPMFDKEQLNFNYNEDIEPLVQKIYQNEDIYLDVYKLLYAGKVDGLEVDNSETDSNIHMILNPLADLALLQKENITLKDSTGNSIEFTFFITDSEVIIDPLTNFIEGEPYTLTFDLEVSDGQNNTYVDVHQHEFVIPDNTPPLIPESMIHVDENKDYIHVNAIDPSSPLNYTLVGGVDEELFEVKSEYNDHIYFKEEPNYERPSDSNSDNIYELEISVVDSFSNMTTKSIQIIVDDVKEGPLLADTNMTVDENAPIGTYVGLMTVVNEGDGNLTEFRTYYQNFEKFRIDNDGKIYTTKTFDYEQVHDVELSIRAKNSVGAWASTKKAYIKINDIDEPLPQVHHFTGSMDDHAPEGKVVGQLYVYPGLDIEAGVRLVGEAADDFDVNASGHITVSATADLNHEVQKQYDLKAIASNSYGESEEANVTIYINVWTKQVGTENSDRVIALTIDKYSNSFLLSHYYDNTSHVNHTQITKRNSDGKVSWQRDLNHTINSMVVDENGTIYLAGSKTTGRTYIISNRTHTAYAAWTMALSSTGDILWSKMFDVGANSSDDFSYILLNSQNELILAGRTSGSFPGYTNQGSYDLIVAKLSREGDVDYIHQIETVASERLYGFKVNKNDEPYMLVLQSEYKLLKLDQTDGHVLSSRSFGSPSNYSYYDYEDFTFDDEGNIYTLIQNYVWWEENIDGSDVYEDDFNCVISKLDPNMNEVWTKSYGTVDREFPESIAINSKNEVYFTGMTEGSLYSNISKKPYLLDYDDDIFLIKVDSNGEMVEAKQFGTINYDSGSFIEIDLNDDIYMAGSINESLDGNHYFGGRDIFLMKVPY